MAKRFLAWTERNVFTQQKAPAAIGVPKLNPEPLLADLEAETFLVQACLRMATIPWFDRTSMPSSR